MALESCEARARLRRKLETWPDGRRSPVTINQGLELLDIVERLEKEAACLAGQLARWDSRFQLSGEKTDKQFWREAARKAVEAQNG